MSEETPEANNQENTEAINNKPVNEVVDTASKAFEKYLKSARYKHHYDVVSEAKNKLEDNNLESVTNSLNYINENVESMKQNAYPCGKAGLYSALEQIQQKAQNLQTEHKDKDIYNQLGQIAGKVGQIFEERINAAKNQASESEGPEFVGQSTENENGPAEASNGGGQDEPLDEAPAQGEKVENSSTAAQISQLGVGNEIPQVQDYEPEASEEETRKRSLSQ